jgi:hypothetical protein
VITDDSSAGPTTELLSGVGVGPIYVLPFEMFYDGITPGTTSPAQTATLFNTTDTVLSVTGVTFVGNAASDFSVTSNGCGDGADPSCPIGVAFTPSTTVLGPRTADLTIATNSETTPSVVSHLTGNGAIQHLPGFTANSFPPNDDDSTSAVNLPFSMNFFGTTYNQLYVNNNGNVTFGEPFGTYTPFGLTGNIGVPIIAPFFADVYTLTPGSDVVHYGVDTVNGQQAFGVNWENVAYYAEPDGEDCPPAILLNSFQLIVIARPDTGAGNFDMEFNYDNKFSAPGFAGEWGSARCTNRRGVPWTDPLGPQLHDAGPIRIPGEKWSGAVGGSRTHDDAICESGSGGLEPDLHAYGDKRRTQRRDEYDCVRYVADECHASVGYTFAGCGLHRHGNSDVQSGHGGECGHGDGDDCGHRECGSDGNAGEQRQRYVGPAGSESGQQYSQRERDDWSEYKRPTHDNPWRKRSRNGEERSHRYQLWGDVFSQFPQRHYSRVDSYAF